jgi:phospholipid/cholesterol/gamma-HCH transport system substrate-binding protein
LHNKTEIRVGIFVLIAIGIFFFMTMQIGVFRLDRGNYKLQLIYFDDVSGLEKKATVKIAGVDVGWVERVELVGDTPYKAKAYVRILKKYTLYADASAVVRQEGLLGTKYLEINPGDPLLPPLLPDHAMGRPGKEMASVDDILHRVKGIASNVDEITGSLKEVLSGTERTEELKAMIHYINQATSRIADFSQVLDRTLSYNEDNINSIMSDVRDCARVMRDSLPIISDDVQRLSNRLETDVLPSFQSSIERIATLFNNDIGRAANQLEKTTRVLEDTALQAQDGVRNISSVAEKINDGRGLIGKLINEEGAYYDLKDAIGGLKTYFAKIDQLSVVVDSHGEYMYRPAERMPFRDCKGYFDVRFHPSDDHFYLVQLVGSQKGSLRRKSVIKNWYDEKGNEFLPSHFFRQAHFLGELVGRIETVERDLDQFKYGLQIGKIFKNIAFRFGLFESTAGMAVDFEVPFDTNKFRWVTTLEIFDLRGRDRIDDPRPHVKWLNRFFVLRNIYLTFGADDFLSRHNANAFFGLGLRFADDDLKYLAAKLSFLAG